MEGREKYRVTPRVTPDEARVDLAAAKARLAQSAANLSANQCITDHPYAVMGAAFISGVFMGFSGEARREVAKIVMETIAKEAFRHTARGEQGS